MATAFPPYDLAPDYTEDNPWTDDYGQQWAYEPDKNRWHALPSNDTGGGTTGTGGGTLAQEYTPMDAYNGLKWFRTIDGVTYTYWDGFWVADDSAPIPGLEDVWAALDTKLSAVTTPISIPLEALTLMQPDHANSYLYFGANVAQTYRVALNDGFSIGTTVTVNNLGLSTLTIDAENGVTLVYQPLVDWNILDPYEMAQLIKVATNTWHLL